MVSNVLFAFFASALLLQTACGQCINNCINQAPVSVGLEGVTLASGGCGLSGLKLGSNVYTTGNAGCGASSLSGPLGANIPNGVSIFAENLEILGQVGVVGSLPFISAVTVEGAMPSSGQATVVYSSAPGIGLISGGCGQGLSGVPGNVLSGTVLNNGLVGLGRNNLLGANVYNGGYSSVGGCGCH